MPSPLIVLLRDLLVVVGLLLVAVVLVELATDGGSVVGQLVVAVVPETTRAVNQYLGRTGTDPAEDDA